MSASGWRPASARGSGGVGRDRVRGHVGLHVTAASVRLVRTFGTHDSRAFCRGLAQERGRIERSADLKPVPQRQVAVLALEGVPAGHRSQPFTWADVGSIHELMHVCSSTLGRGWSHGHSNLMTEFLVCQDLLL